MTPPTVIPRLKFTLYGACESKEFLEGLEFAEQGATATGAPYFKTRAVEGGSEYYIYYDPDCSASGDGIPNWIIDDSAPDTNVLSDLDGDKQCEYFARLDSSSLPAFGKTRPPEIATWRMHCKGNFPDSLPYWQDTVLTLSDRPRQTTIAPSVPDAIQLSGACDYFGFLNDFVFNRHGATQGGAPYYKAAVGHYFIYFDPSCDDAPNGKARWILDSNEPKLDRLNDLDDDGHCQYFARVDSTDSSKPPARAEWLMYCGDAWQERFLNLKGVESTAGTVDLQAATSGAVMWHRSCVLAFVFLIIHAVNG